MHCWRSFSGYVEAATHEDIEHWLFKLLWFVQGSVLSNILLYIYCSNTFICSGICIIQHPPVQRLKPLYCIIQYLPVPKAQTPSFSMRFLWDLLRERLYLEVLCILWCSMHDFNFILITSLILFEWQFNVKFSFIRTLLCTERLNLCYLCLQSMRCGSISYLCRGKFTGSVKGFLVLNLLKYN